MAVKKPTKKTIVKAAEDVQSNLDNMITLDQKMLQDAITKLEKEIMRMMRELELTDAGLLVGPKVNLVQAQRIHKNLLKVFNKTFGKAAKRTVRGWNKLDAYVLKYLKKYIGAAEMTGVDDVILNQLEDSAILGFLDLSRQAQNKVAQALYTNIATQSPFDDLITTIQGVLTGNKDAKGRPLSQYADLYANDGVMNFYNSVQIYRGREAGLTHYLYVGNVMGTTREFCRKRVGNVYSAEEINSWTFDWTGKSGPAMTHRGGWNCRHHWQAVNPEWFE